MFQSPISGSQTRRLTSKLSGYFDVSIPYKRVTNEFTLTTGQVTGHSFQSPISGSQTEKRMRDDKFTTFVSIPYKRVTNGKERLMVNVITPSFNPL